MFCFCLVPCMATGLLYLKSRKIGKHQKMLADFFFLPLSTAQSKRTATSAKKSLSTVGCFQKYGQTKNTYPPKGQLSPCVLRQTFQERMPTDFFPLPDTASPAPMILTLLSPFALKRRYLIFLISTRFLFEYGILWRSPAQLNSGVMFD